MTTQEYVALRIGDIVYVGGPVERVALVTNPGHPQSNSILAIYAGETDVTVVPREYVMDGFKISRWDEIT